MTTAEWVLVGGLLVSLAAHVFSFLGDRRKVQVESISFEAAAQLADAQASDILIRNLTEQYARVEQLYRETIGEVAFLRAQVENLQAVIDEVEGIVKTLPDDIRSRIEPHLRRRRRTASE